MSKELRPVYYYYIRRKWFSQLVQSCSEVIDKKGKDPITLFWKAFGLGMTGDLDGCLRELDAFHARKDLQFPVNLAMIYFHKKAPSVDRETVRAITSELPLAEDVAKEAGIVLAARFQCLVGNYHEGKRLARKVIESGRGNNDTASVFESEAAIIEQWCILEEGVLSATSVSDLRRTMTGVSESRGRIGADQDPDGLMLLARAKLVLDLDYEALAFLNLAISKFPTFTPALCEKALLLASSGDWEQALDGAQRLLDNDADHLDGLLIVAVHAYTQEGLSHDAVQKLEDMDQALKKKESVSVTLAIQISSLFARICGRHARTLQLCARLLERSLKQALHVGAETEAKVFCVLGEIYLRQGRAQLEKALSVLREATKRDATNLRVLLTLIHAQLVEGAVEDAEAQVELLSLMHGNLDELGHEILYLQALILRQKQLDQSHNNDGDRDRHTQRSEEQQQRAQREELLLKCKHLFLQTQSSSSSSVLASLQQPQVQQAQALLDPDTSFLPSHFTHLYRRDPDFALLLSEEFFALMESSALGTSLVPSGAASAGLLSQQFNSNTASSNNSTGNNNNNNTMMTLGNGRQTMAVMTLNNTAASYNNNNNHNPNQAMMTAMTLGDVASTLNTLSLVGSSLASKSGGANHSNSNNGSAGSQMMHTAEASRETLEMLQHGLDLLLPLLQAVPGILPMHLEVARAYYTAGQLDEAVSILQHALSLQPTSAALLVALALVEAARWQSNVASRLVEQALSADFSIRSAAKFRLVKAIVYAQQSKFSEAVEEMTQLMAAGDFNFTLSSSSTSANNEVDPAFQRLQQLDQRAQLHNNSSNSNNMDHYGGMGGSYSDMLRLTLDDRVLAFVSFASLLSHERRLKEARQVLAHAKAIFAGLSQEVHVLVAAARLYVDRGDFDAAVRMLDKISPDAAAFPQAQLVKADILLTHNHDKEGYARCFQLLVDRQRSAANLALLAEAYLRILNPEKAVDVFEEAFKMDPKNTRLRARIGKTLVSTHEYHRAVEFYETAVRQILIQHNNNNNNNDIGRTTKNNTNANSGNNSANLLSSEDFGLVLDLAALYRRLTRYESAARVLNDVMSLNNNNSNSNNNMDSNGNSNNGNNNGNSGVLRRKHRVQALLQLSLVQQTTGVTDAQQTSLLQAHLLQREHLTSLRSSSVNMVAAQRERIDEEKTFFAAICCQLGAALLAEGELSEAERYYDEGMKADAQCLAAMLGLAQVALRRGDWEKCQAQCSRVLTAAPTHRDAAILLSETLLRANNDPEAAAVPLVQYLSLLPSDYLALDKAVTLLRRAGQLPEALRLIKEAETVDKKHITQPGYHYCQGLYSRFTNDIGKAIASFNLARRDSQFAAFSLAHMIELYLNPDQEGVWEEKETGPVDEETRAHIAAAEELLRELKRVTGNGEDMRVKVLEAYCLLATRNKVGVDKAMQMFAELLDQNQEYLPAVLGMATGFMIEKNQHKARNLLKRIGKMEVSKHDGEDFEKANLLLAKFYIDKASYDKAQEVCRKALLQNKSCAQAWEILGLVCEKEGNYEHAADAYRKAWLLEFEASASVGFKLAFSLLKCRRLVETVDVCETVLKLYPDYPRIKEEILTKALVCIRSANAPA